MRHWNTKEQDLMTAKNVLHRHYDDLSEQSVGIQEIAISPDGGIQVERSDWVVELEQTFEEQYGEKTGLDITRKVLTALLTQGEMVH